MAQFYVSDDEDRWKTWAVVGKIENMQTNDYWKQNEEKKRTRKIIETEKEMRKAGRQSLNEMYKYTRKDRDKQTRKLIKRY
jgi:hypothetical protein